MNNKQFYTLLLVLLIYPVSGHAASVLNFDQDHAAESFIVGFNPKSIGRELDPLLHRYQHIGLKLRLRFKLTAAVSLSFSAELLRASGMNLQSLVKEIATVSGIAYVEANTILRSDVIPNDARYPEQFAMQQTADRVGTIGMPLAWDLVANNKPVVVAVIDSGVNTEHPDLAGSAWENTGEVGLDHEGRDKRSNGIDDDGNSYVDDWRGWDFVGQDNDPKDDATLTHGTHCAGIVAARGNNEIGIAGINWTAKVLPLRFISVNGTGELDHAIAAIEYAFQAKADILNNSWGGGGHSPTMFAAIAALADSALFVAAAGNSGVNNDEKPHFPSSYTLDHIVSVAASNRTDKLAGFANFGIKSVDIAAPGTRVLSLMGPDRYEFLNGSSMAAPHVSGAASLLRAKYPQLTPLDIKTRLLASATWMEHLASKLQSGARLDVANALEDDQIAPSAVDGIRQLDKDVTSLTVTWNASGDDGENGVASRYLLRYSSEPIVDEEGWAKATQAQGHWLEGGLGFVLQGLEHNFTGYLVVRALDNVGAISPIGSAIEIQTLKIDPVYSFALDDPSSVQLDTPWRLLAQDDSPGGQLDDSVGGEYANDTDSSVYLSLNNDQQFRGPLYLTFMHSLDLERGYDFGIVEISIDNGETWQEINRFTGKLPWSFNHVLLPTDLLSASQFRLRFRLLTDYVTVADGWRISTVQLQAPSSDAAP